MVMISGAGRQRYLDQQSGNEDQTPKYREDQSDSSRKKHSA
ncbi:predicted protein [Plenodomus lingam JN3]|uniref:Predicted protein n=1 Tax=Leptosphaeria maculans (strain JN3 / isolate v23.1.3 / race Av1-4-5-6-7-8) TaxID=985895 RepID=E5ADP3_LEPMJ|nr:predicted protein [Plenodomus lingam JN3]CBY01332.1 predicted protein [Plenodomus lingam JN3]